ncbi:hypothetical protein [Bradyrhizobium sp. LMG 9283]|uniref:hypothetical protein n=1 Tax=Bradyrhizobium sp. LMG 9283 TaxID=592064 RepID=UPI003890A259
MANIVATFKALSLDEMIEAYPHITALLSAAKDARRLQLEAEIQAPWVQAGRGQASTLGRNQVSQYSRPV